jgi:ribosomal protein L24
MGEIKTGDKVRIKVGDHKGLEAAVTDVVEAKQTIYVLTGKGLDYPTPYELEEIEKI